MELQPRSSGFSVRFGVTHPPAIPDMYQVLVKKLDYRAEFVESGKNKSAKLGTLKRGELIEGLPGEGCQMTDAKGVVWIYFARPDFGRDGVGWAPLTEKRNKALQLQPPPKVMGELGGEREEVVVDVHPTWAPLGAARFRELCEAQFFVGCRFFRVVPGFVCQWGLGEPRDNDAWEQLADEPRLQSNLRGTLSFANSGPHTRGTQVFVNYDDALSLDDRDFVPFAEVVEGMEALDGVFSGYGEEPDQGRIRSEGNGYLRSEFPQLSFIDSVEILEPEVDESAPPPEAAMWSPRVDRFTGKPYVEHIHTGERRDAPPESTAPAPSAQPGDGITPRVGAGAEAASGGGLRKIPSADFGGFEDDEGFEAHFSDDAKSDDAAPAAEPDYGDYGGVSLEDAMGGGWSDDDDVRRTIIAGIWVAFFQRVPAIIVRTG